MRWLCSLLAALLLFPVAAMAQTESDQLIQGLRPQGMVSDFAGVMSSGERRGLENLLRELKQKTGAEVAVVAISSMRGGEINDFATRLFEAWGIGKQGKDNGALLLAAIEDRKARIEIGYGLEGVIPDAKAGRLLDTYVIPYFRQQQYAQGLSAGARALASLIAQDAGVDLTGIAAPRAPPPQRGWGSRLLHLLFLIILIPILIRNPWLILFLLSSGRGGGFSGGGFGGGFGGFGGGLSGGGGASRGW